MRIQHNIMAMNAYRNYNTNTSALAKNLEKLSSGYKINRAGDDAAGLAISEKMRAQITGLDAATKNVKDGISLVKTAEGAMQEIQDMLNRMDYLATQSANGTYQDEVDRENLQKEVNQLLSEIDRIADSSNFNGIKLLDGSLDQSTRVNKTEGQFTLGGTAGAQGVLPAVGDTLGTDTVLHEGAATAGGDNIFGLELHNLSVTGDAGDTFTITIGDKTLTGTLAASAVTTPLSAEDVAKALTGDDDTKITFEVDGEAFDPTAFEIGGGTFKAELSDSGTGVTFTQTDDATLTTVAFNVTIAKGADAPGGTAPDVTTADGTAAGGKFTTGTPAAGTDVTALTTTDLSGTNLSGELANIKALTLTFGTGASQVAVKLDGLKEDGTDPDALKAEIEGLINKAFADKDTALKAGTTTYTKMSDAVLTFDANGISVAFNETSETYAAVAAAGATATVDFTGQTGADVIGSTVTVGDKTYQFVKDAGDVTAGNTAVVVAEDADVDALTAALAGAAAPTGVTATDNNDGTVTFTTTATGADAKLDAFGTSTATAVAVSGEYNVSTTDQSLKADAAAGRLASTKFTLTEAMASNGSTIRIGEETYTFSNEQSTKANTVYVGDLDLTDAADLATAAQRLTDAAVGNTTYSVGQKDGVITVTERPDYTTGSQKYDLSTEDGIKASLGFATATTVTGSGKSLQLQIGDTSDSFNQLQVSVGDMHAAALGLKGLDISNASAASNAIQTIKNAINQVSSVRGDLGATQNRLEHTQNNLSVMKENIQDAESTIRDTDVAEEMMAYTKNNILIQSAQAMLAQANAVPQGVLQLLG